MVEQPQNCWRQPGDGANNPCLLLLAGISLEENKIKATARRNKHLAGGVVTNLG